MAKSTVVFENETYNGETLTDDEQNLLKNQLYSILGAESTILSSLFRENERKVIGAAEVAKEKLDAPFTGLSAGDSEFGMQLIRPGHVLRTTGSTETCETTWIRTLTADDDYWIGYGTNNTTAVNIDKRLLVLVLGVTFTSGNAPVSEELYLTVGSTTYPVMVLRNGWWADNPNGVRFTRIRPLIFVPKTTVLGRTYQELAGEQELVLVGISFGMGDLLRTRELSSVQT